MPVFLYLMCSFFIVCSTSGAEAAAPATHVYFAELWMKAREITESAEREPLIAGTLFPDIRYLGTISRSETHDKNVNAKEIRKAVTPFTAGKLLHSFVDEKRVRFVKDAKIFSRLKKIPKKQRILFLKLLEDEVLWDRINKEETTKALKTPYHEEIQAGVDPFTVEVWHQTMSAYLQQRPSVFLTQLAENQSGFLSADAETVAIWSRLLPEMASETLFQEYVEMMVADLFGKFTQK